MRLAAIILALGAEFALVVAAGMPLIWLTAPAGIVLALELVRLHRARHVWAPMWIPIFLIVLAVSSLLRPEPTDGTGQLLRLFSLLLWTTYMIAQWLIARPWSRRVRI